MADTPTTPQQRQADQSPRRRFVLRHIWRVAFLGGSATLLLIALLAVAARIYLSDERLRQMGEQQLTKMLATEVTIGAMEVSLVAGVELRRLQVNPPKGFEEKVLSLERLALRWSLWRLLGLVVRIDEFAVEGLSLTLESAHGQSNIDVLLARLGPTAPESTEPEKAAAAPLDLTQIRLPIRVEANDVHVTDLSARILEPGLSLSVDEVNLEARFAGEGEALDLDLWVGLGERPPAIGPSTLVLERAQPTVKLSLLQRLGVSVRTSGLGDIALGMKLDATTEVTEPPVGSLRAQGQLAVVTDLLGQVLEVATCHWQVGELTRVDLEASVSEFLGDPKISLQRLLVASSLGEFSPTAAAVVPGVSFAGELEATLEPFASSVSALAGQQVPSTRLQARGESLDVHVDEIEVDGAAFAASVDLDEDAAKLSINATVKSARSLDQVVRGVAVRLGADTAIAPWLGAADKSSEVTAHLEVEVESASAPVGQVRGVALAADLVAPIGTVLTRVGEPVEVTVDLKAQSATAPQGEIGAIDVHLEVSSSDLVAPSAEAFLRAGVNSVTAVQGEETIKVTDIGVRLRAAKKDDRIDLDELGLRVADLLRLDAHGSVEKATSSVPRVGDFVLNLTADDIRAILALLPAQSRPPGQVEGGVALQLRLNGSVPYRALQAKAQPPALVMENGRVHWAKTVAVYADFGEAWAAELERGLPFVAAMVLDLRNLSFEDDTQQARGVTVDLDFEMQEHGPQMRFEAGVDELRQTEAARTVRNASVKLGFGFGSSVTELGLDVTLGTLEDPTLAEAVRDATFSTAIRYRMRGDVILERLRLEAPSLGIVVAAQGLITKPIRLVLARAWEQAELPGVDVDLTWQVGISRPEMRPVTVGGPALGGSVVFSGAIGVHEGVGAVRGNLTADGFTAVAGDTHLEGLSGELPFDIRLAFRPDPEATVLARETGFGGNVVALYTSADDIRNLPARPTYYQRLRPYRLKSGLRIARVRHGPYEITDFELDGRLEQGMLLADWISMHILGGDVVGNLALQLGRSSEVRGDLAFQISNIDASYFEALSIEPGPESELNADLQLDFLFGPGQRDLSLNANVTKIGSETLDRFLQSLDPEGTNPDIQDTRSNLGYVTIDGVAVWIRYENLNIDLAYTAVFRIPFTKIGYRPIPSETVRRLPLRETLNVQLQPVIDQTLAPLLGWGGVRGS